MKTVLSVFCCLVIMVMLGGCRNGDDGGSSGGPGRWPTVSFTVDDNGNVTCFNADSNVITTKQICIWNCAYYELNKPRFVKLEFDEALVCRDIDIEEPEEPAEGEEPEIEVEITQECENQVALVHEYFESCRLDNPPPY